MSLCSLNYCTVCPLARQNRKPLSLSTSSTTEVFHLLHIDIWGPYKILTVIGHRFFLIIVDDHSKMIWVFLMKFKSDSVVLFISIVKMVNVQFEKQVKMIKTNDEFEFFSKEFFNFLIHSGIGHQSSFPPHSTIKLSGREEA